MSAPHPEPPADIARILRQESNFGCCKCGCPIIEYHHIIPYRQEEHFRTEDMMCLCPTCHKVSDRWSEKKQRNYKANPFNKSGRRSSYILENEDESPVLFLGSVCFEGYGTLLTIDGEKIIEIKPAEDGYLLLSINLLNESGRSIFRIIDNEFIPTDNTPWDFEYTRSQLTVRSQPYNVALRITGGYDGAPFSLTGKFHLGGKKVYITEKVIKAPHLEMSYAYLKNMGLVFINGKSTGMTVNGKPAIIGTNHPQYALYASRRIK